MTATVAGVEHRFLDAGDLRVHVAEAGSGEPLVMLHGWPQNWYAFRHLIPTLSAHYRVICPDLRGFGTTDAPATGYEVNQLARDLEAVLDGLSIERVRLVGHDWGSFIGFTFAAAQPERVLRFVPMGGWHPWPRISLRGTLALRRFWYQWAISTPGLGPRLVANPGFIRLLYRLWSAREDVWSEEDLRVLTAQFTEPARAVATTKLYRYLVTRLLPGLVLGSHRSTYVDTPVLFLHGVDDGCISPVFTGGGRRHAPNMVVELLPGVGHFVPEEAPELVLPRLLEFLG